MALIGNGTADDRAALQALLNAASPHDTVTLPPHSTFRTCINYQVPDRGLIIPQGVTLDLNGSRLNLEQDNDVYGVRLKDGSRLIGHGGTVAVTAVSSVGSQQSIYQSVISLGCALSDVLSPANQGPFHNAGGWLIADLELSTAKPNGHHLAGIGGIHDGVISDIVVRDNATAVGAINFDWGTVGPTGTIPQNRANFTNGSFFTVHPRGIEIIRARIGKFDNLNSEAIRLSGCSAIRVSQSTVKYAGGAGFAHYGGDFGFEFAPAGIDRYRGFTNTTVRDLEVGGCAPSGAAVRVDTFADNIAREPGYVPSWKPVYDTNLLIDGLFANVVNGTGVVMGPNSGVMIERAHIRWSRTGFNLGNNISRAVVRDSLVYGIDASATFVVGPTSGVTFTNNIYAY